MNNTRDTKLDDGPLVKSVVSHPLTHQLIVYSNNTKTRKLCYRKDDRAMRPIHGCPENVRDSMTTPTATIPNIFHGLLF